MEMIIIPWGQAGSFVHNGIRSAVKWTVSVSDRLLYKIQRGRWCDIIVLNLYAPVDNKSDDKEESFYEELEHVFDQFPMYNMKTVLGHFREKVWSREI
jgi:hypothetical protein